MGIDSQGVKRGACSSCDCKEYQKKNGNKCSECGHPPVKHQKLGGGVNRAGHQASSHNVYMQKSDITCTREGCSNKVMIHPQYGPFSYCTPQCRDTDLISSGKAKKELDATLQKLQESHRNYLSTHNHTKKKAKGKEIDENMDFKEQGSFQASTPDSSVAQGDMSPGLLPVARESDALSSSFNTDTKQLSISGQDEGLGDLVTTTVYRQSSKDRIGLIFFNNGEKIKLFQSEYEGLFLTGFDINIIREQTDLQLFDGIITEKEPGALFKDSIETKITVLRHPSPLQVFRKDIETKEWTKVAKERATKRNTLCLVIAVKLQKYEKRKDKLQLKDIIGATLTSVAGGCQVNNLLSNSLAKKCGVLNDDTIIAASVLTGDGYSKPDCDWSPEGLLEQAKRESAKAMLCVIQRKKISNN